MQDSEYLTKAAIDSARGLPPREKVTPMRATTTDDPDRSGCGRGWRSGTTCPAACQVGNPVDRQRAASATRSHRPGWRAGTRYRMVRAGWDKSPTH